jgi:hypothetical protein
MASKTNADHKIPGFKHIQDGYWPFDNVLPVQKQRGQSHRTKAL